MTTREPNENERCPCCDREIGHFADYPLMYILSVSLMKPEEVPAIIRGAEEVFHKERLVEKTGFFGRRNKVVVPAGVIAHFTAHPDETEHLYSDGYVYEMHNKVPRRYKWSRFPNISNQIREVIQNNTTLQTYLASLEEMVGETILTKDFINQFGTDKEITEKLGVSFTEGEPGQGFRTVKFELIDNSAEHFYDRFGMWYNTVLDNLATVRYVGKMLGGRDDNTK